MPVLRGPGPGPPARGPGDGGPGPGRLGHSAWSPDPELSPNQSCLPVMIKPEVPGHGPPGFLPGGGSESYQPE